jgi:hypothetical protein
MGEEHTTASIQRFLDDLAGIKGDSPVEPIVSDLLARSVNRLHLLCATLLFRVELMQPGELDLSSQTASWP